MARDVSQTMIEAASADVVYPIMFIEAEFDSGTTRMWSGIGDLSWDDKVWTGGGSLLALDSVEESTEIKAIGTKVTLSGIPSELISLALQENYQGRTLKVYLGAFTNVTGFMMLQNGSYLLKQDGDKLVSFNDKDIVADPIVIFSGRMDIMNIQESGGTSTIGVTVENRLIDFERTRERRYTSEDQKIDYPNDKGFEFVSSIQDVNIVWGKV